MFGCLSVVWASYDHLEIAAIFIFIAAVMDFLDGLAARLLKAYSAIGAQLDSLADMISFGFAPAFLVFEHVLALSDSSALNQMLLFQKWIPVIILLLPFILSIFAALRLARFNIDARQEDYFVGLPTPAMALFFASSVYLFQNTNLHLLFKLMNTIFFWNGLAVLFSLLMISGIRMISFKLRNMRWADNRFQYLFVGISLILLVSLHEISIPIIIIWYIILSFVYHISKVKPVSL